MSQTPLGEPGDEIGPPRHCHRQPGLPHASPTGTPYLALQQLPALAAQRPSGRLDQLQLAVFTSCYAGKGGPQSQNWVRETAAAGAWCTVGWIDQTWLLYDWTRAFLSRCLAGQRVTTAAVAACSAGVVPNLFTEVVVGGTDIVVDRGIVLP